MTLAKVCIALCWGTLLCGVAHAQLLPTPLRARQQGVTLSVTVDPALITSAAYTYTFGFARRRPDLSVGAGLHLPVLALGERVAFRADLLVGSRWLSDAGWGAALLLRAYLVGDTGDTGESLGLGLELRAQPGHYGRRWAGGLDLGWQGTLLARLLHSELVRQSFADRGGGSDGPVDGWYANTAHRFRIGLAGGYAPLDWLALQLALGSLFSIQSQGVLYNLALAQIPIYLELAARLSW